MAPVKVQASYYQQFDADYSRDVPAEGYGGWRKAVIEIAPEHTAVVLMHAWDCGTLEEYPGWWQACDEIPRTYHVCRTVLPGLLAAVRASGPALFHVVAAGDYYRGCPGYRRAAALAGEPPPAPERIAPDPVWRALGEFRSKNAFPGAHNEADINRGWARVGFPPEAAPVGEEGVAENTEQLFALCKEGGINHLVYAGFNVDWCLLMSSGGMIDMSRHGLICSVLRQATTAVENKETARRELCKEIGLWRVAINFGFVFDVDDFVRAIGGQR